jgi:hypothetical protein
LDEVVISGHVVRLGAGVLFQRRVEGFADVRDVVASWSKVDTRGAERCEI